MGLLAGYIVPHPPLAVESIGKENILEIPATMESFHKVAKDIAKLKPDTIVVTSPHSIMYSDYFHISPGAKAEGDFGNFGVPEISMCADYDEQLAKNIGYFCRDTYFPAGPQGDRQPWLDHGTMVPLYFVNQYYTDYDLIRIGLSGLPLEQHYHFGRLIEKCLSVSDKRIVFIASGDLSHCQKEDGPYGYKPQGPMYDDKLMETLRGGDLDKLLDFDEHLLEEAQECGHRSFTIMAGAFKDYDYDIEVLSHENTFGVGYGFAIVRIKGKE